MKEQRRYLRIRSRQRCWCETDDLTIYAQIENLSEGGLFLRASAPLPHGAQVRLRLGSGASEVDTAAAVIWHRGGSGSEEEPGMGLRFEGLDRRSVTALQGQVYSIACSGV